jgi:outer membrane protein
MQRIIFPSAVKLIHLIVVLALAITTSYSAVPEPAPLSLQEAHEMALRNHPQISVADLVALATRQAARIARSGFFPNVSANVVAVGTADNNTRLAAIGALNNPSIFDRNAAGLMISQLITDFGRTANLARSAEYQAKAAENNAQATREQILLEVDNAFYGALQAQALTRVAQQTVTARQFFYNQVYALSTNQMRSELDVSFARVNLEDARLLLSKAQNDLQASFTELSTLMGQREPQTYQLIEQPLPSQVATNASEFVQQALTARPDLLRLRNEREAAWRLARSEHAAHFPTIAAVAAAGALPVHDEQLSDAYAAAGLTLTVPLYAGGLYAARQKEAELRAQAAEAGLRDLEDNIIRDVRISWLNAQNAFDRYQITGQLLQTAKRSLQLAQARYDAGTSSIVELNQAQLNEISAEISYATTRYEYMIQRSALSFQTGSLR